MLRASRARWHGLNRSSASKADVSGRVYVGTSGWNYASWREDFYRGIPRTDWLGFYAERFTGIDVNATFYRLQDKKTFRRWRDETPADFRFAIKGNRFLTHNKKLSDALPAIRIERDRATGLGNKLAAVVWQLPALFHKDMKKLQGFVRALKSWRAVRHAVEFRHDSWFDDEVAECLRAQRLAVCQSDAADWPLWETVTTDMVYIRLHGHAVTYASSYSTAELGQWAKRIRDWLQEGRDVHVYFDNDALGAAPKSAQKLMELVKTGKHRRN
jgi:uncharacterized protein YecE (DUF72 family)